MKWLTTILICCVLALTGLGLVMLYSCSMNMEVGKRAVGAKYLISQLTFCGFGLLLGAAVACTDYRRLKTISPYLLMLAGFLLLLVFAPKIGFGTKGARRWIAIPHLPHFQPSEFAKLALIIFLAAYCERFQRQMHTFKQGLVIPSCVIAMVLALIFIEPDRGCTILLAAVSAAMLIIAGVRWRFIIPPVIAAAAALAFSLVHDPMRMGRILAWLHPEQHKDASYQAYEAMLALGSGGLFGLGLGNGRQKLGFVPEHHTDFIFSIIGEELGIIATLSVVVIFIVLIVCGTIIARRSCDTFGTLLGLGITFMIGFQAFINMGVVTSLLPNKGMPLPFISYGGSNLLLMLVAIGLLLSISRFAVEPVRKRRNPFDIPTAELSDA